MPTVAASGRRCSHRCKQCNPAQRVGSVLSARTMPDVDRELAALREARDRLREQLREQVFSERSIYASRYGIAVPRSKKELTHA